MIRTQGNSLYRIKQFNGGALGLPGAVLPALRAAFKFAPLHPIDLAIYLAAGLASFPLIELLEFNQTPS
jgi:hypothetical protein